MISRSQQLLPRFFFSSLIFLLIFILSGCSEVSDTSSTPQDGNQQPTAKIIASLASAAGKTVTLDGSSSSDPDGDELSFRWEQIEGPSMTLSGVSTATLSFVAPTVLQSTQFTFQLTVDDGDLSSTASVSFQLSPSDTSSDQPNQQPYAMITAPEAVTSGQMVTLNGSGSSDPDGDNLSYKWTQMGGADITLSNNTSSTLTFVAPTVSQTTEFTFQLTVDDGALASSASVNIQVTPRTTANQQPSAKITAPQTATSGQTVTLNGSDSSDPDGGTLSYQWKQTQGLEIVLSNSSSSSPTFVAPEVTQATQFTFQLTVHDGELSNSASVSMQILPMDGNTSPTCATAEENNSLTLSCPSGEVITDVVFASYGTPVGSCGSFTKGSCNASNSVTVVSDTCKGKNSCVLYAGSETFGGDPCEEAVKKLSAQVVCGMETDQTPEPTPVPTQEPAQEPNTAESGCDMSELLAFPCAEGYGKYTTGGRGGEVYEVTNLNSSGAGSLGDALSKSGRTVVFRVSGTIKGRFDVPENTTIAGQTAPGDGIAIHGQLGLDSNVIIRYIRVRFDGKGDEDAIGERYSKNIIVDHVTGSWSRDEVMSIYHNEDVTIQWSMVTQACPNEGTESHRFGGIWGNERGSYHHNLIAHNENRNIRWASGCGYNDYRNNVIYNWGYGSCYGGEAHQVGDRRKPPIEHSTINMVANYYKAGPGTSDAKGRIFNGSTRGGDGDAGNWHVSKNVMVGNDEVTRDNWKGTGGTFHKLDSPWDAMPLNEETAEAAYEAVLADVGCTKPARDSLDAKIIEDVRNGTTSIGKNGFISCPSDAKLPTLNSTPAPADSDHDGMPDDWETANGLDPNNAEDRNKTYGPGYTMLEKYLNSLDSF